MFSLDGWVDGPAMYIMYVFQTIEIEATMNNQSNIRF